LACVRVVATIVFLCVFLLPYSVLIVNNCVRHERLQFVEIPHNRILYIRKILWHSSLIFGSLERG
jgi:Na+/alanine symporter